LVLVATIICGIRGDPALLFASSQRTFTGTGPQSFHFDAAPVSALNRFLTIKLSFSGPRSPLRSRTQFRRTQTASSGRKLAAKSKISRSRLAILARLGGFLSSLTGRSITPQSSSL
jgi:hypothetical protein